MKKNNKKVFSRIGFSLVAIELVGALVVGIIYVILAGMPEVIQWLEGSATAMLVLNFAPMYIVAFPTGVWIMKKLPSQTGEQITWKGTRLLQYALMCMPVMYVGNLIGTLLSGILSGGQATNVVVEMLTGNIAGEILFLAILAPLFEEYVFRKLLIDKTVRYGEKTAVIFSALVFGLFHGNLFQFFYTFGIGFIWAYVYVKTRKFSYTFVLHALFNFIGGILPSMLMNVMGEEGMTAIANMDMAVLETMPTALAIYGLYGIVILTLVITGAVVLFRNRKQFTFVTAENREEEEGTEERNQEEKEENKIGPGTIFLNPGMVCFTIMIVASFVYMLFI